MRKVEKDFDSPPAELLECAKKNEVDLLEKKEVKDSCYKKSRNKLEELYFEKCAYCETEYLKNTDTWVEHYRPKSIYYWLAYEWSNLIPTCPKCNRIKKDKFPLINFDNQILAPPIKNNELDNEKCKADCFELMAEKPYVLHPEIDEPENFLDFKLNSNKNGIEITGIDADGKGEKTAEICDLNRTSLRLDRQKRVIDALIESIENLFCYIEDDQVQIKDFYNLFKIICQKLENKANNIKLEHTLFRKKILKTEAFETIVCPYIKDFNQRKIVIQAYKKYTGN